MLRHTDTSRYPPRSSLYGKHGDFLASLATLSLLSITSRNQTHVSHNTISIHNSQILSRHLPSPPEQRLVNFDHGTRVTVRDLFGSLPVRVKQRAAFSERSVSDREWTKLIREVIALLLAWPTGITIHIREIVTQRELRLRPSETADIISRTTRLLTQASLADSGDVGSWVPISAASGSISIKGCICANPVATRRTQFISLGIHPLSNEYGTDVLYEEINRVFSNSSFGVIEGDENQPENVQLDGFSGKELRIRKGIERWPMFYLRITASTWTGDAGVEEKLDSRGKDLAVILDLLRALCYGFLKKHHFEPRKVRMSKDESLFSTSRTLGRSNRPSKKQKTSSSSSRSGSMSRTSTPSSLSRANSPFDSWDRMKVGKATPLTTASKSVSLRPKDKETTVVTPLVGEGGKLLRKPFDEPSPEPEDVEVSNGSKTAVDPTTPLPATQSSVGESQTLVKEGKRAEEATKRKPSQWLQRVQASWTNPVFETVQSSAPQTKVDCAMSHKDGFSGCCGGDGTADSTSTNLSGRISKEALARACVISQVDRKFILVKLPLQSLKSGEAQKGESSTLIMLDQHAADERCRLEDLMQNYFAEDPNSGKLKANVEPLERPLTYAVSSKEFELLDQHRSHFASWGIHYRPNPRQAEITITALPPSILTRCRLEPRLLIETLRKEIWRLADEGFPTRTQTSDPPSTKAWIINFHGCPRGILELLHSRACRSK